MGLIWTKRIRQCINSSLFYLRKFHSMPKKFLLSIYCLLLFGIVPFSFGNDETVISDIKSMYNMDSNLINARHAFSIAGVRTSLSYFIYGADGTPEIAFNAGIGDGSNLPLPYI